MKTKVKQILDENLNIVSVIREGCKVTVNFKNVYIFIHLGVAKEVEKYLKQFII
nr:MAG TPA: hypothetical protein [Bacteriophage sp.]